MNEPISKSIQPLSRSVANTGFDDSWTCPSCYNELGNVGIGETQCPSCHAKLVCYVERIPQCVAELASGCRPQCDSLTDDEVDALQTEENYYGKEET